MTKSNWSQFFFFPPRFVHAWLPFFRAFSRTLFLEVLATVPFVPGTFAFFFLLEPLFASPSERAFAFRCFLFLSELQYYEERERELYICIFLGKCLGVLWLHCFCLRFCGLFLARWCTAWSVTLYLCLFRFRDFGEVSEIYRVCGMQLAY